MSLKSNFLKNSIYNASGWIWLTILNIIVTPYMLRKLGYDGYGIFSLVLMILGYFAFLDFGLGDAVVKYVAHYNATGDPQKINKILSSILFLFVLIGIFGAIIILIFTKYFSLKVFKIPLYLQSSAKFCFYLGALGFFLNLIFGVISKIPEALQRFDVSNKKNVIIGTIITLGNVGILAMGFGVKEIVVMNFIGSIASIFVFFKASKKLLPELKVNLIYSSQEFKEIFRFGIYTVYTKFSSLITSSINQLFIGFFVGPAGLTVFNIPFKIVSRIQAFIQRLAVIFFPLSSELSAKAEIERLRKVYLKLGHYIFFLSSLFFIPILAYSYPILKYWLGKEFADKGAYSMFMISVTFFLISLTMVPGLVALGVGKPKYNALFSTITAIINLLFVYPFTRKWGIAGASTALFISSLQAPVAIYVINKNIMRIRINEYIKRVFGRDIFPLIILFITFLHFGNKIIVNIWTFIFVFFLSYLLLGLLFWYIGLQSDDKYYLINRLRQIRKITSA